MFWCHRFVYGVGKNALYCVPSFSNVLFVFFEFVTVICLFCFSDVLSQNRCMSLDLSCKKLSLRNLSV